MNKEVKQITEELQKAIQADKNTENELYFRFPASISPPIHPSIH